MGFKADSEEREYTLQVGLIGQLYPALKDAQGRVIDGNTRLDKDPNWRTEVREDIDTDRKYWAAKIGANTCRRIVPQEETAVDIKNLADAIVEEKGTTRGLIRQIKEDTGLSEPYILKRLRMAEGQTGVDPGYINPSAEEETVLPSVEEVIAPTSRMPDKSTFAFQSQVEQTVGRLVGLPLESIIKRLIAAYELTEEEAKGYIERWKRDNADLWGTLYDSKDEVRITSPESVPEEEKKEEKPSQSEDIQEDAPPGLQFSRDELLITAMKYYPDQIINKMWTKVEMDSKKLSFFQELFTVTWEMALESHSEEELLNIVYSRM